ncbi:hypothetical protein LTS02_012189, partial [Friedmanniomyces endolithicus]
PGTKLPSVAPHGNTAPNLVLGSHSKRLQGSEWECPPMGYGSKLPEGTVLVNPVDVLCVGVFDGKDLIDVTVPSSTHSPAVR